MFNITFLGTAQAVPTKERSHTAILLSHGSEKILVDCGEGTQRQFRIAEINPCKLTRLLITHWHGDHILGLPGLLQTLALNGYNKPLQIYGPQGTKRFMELIRSIFVPRGNIRISVVEKAGKIIETKDFSVEAFSMKHSCRCFAYSFKEKDKRRIDKKKIKKIGIKGKLVGELQKGKSIRFNGRAIKPSQISYMQKGKKVCIVLDTSYTEEAVKAARDSDLLIIEGTYEKGLEEKAARYKHLTTEQAARIAKKARVKDMIITHISQRYKDTKKLVKEIKKIFPSVKIARDFMKISV